MLKYLVPFVFVFYHNNSHFLRVLAPLPPLQGVKALKRLRFSSPSGEVPRSGGGVYFLTFT